MFNHKKTDIVVLGAGPVGLIAAHALASRNIDYVLLDRQQRTETTVIQQNLRSDKEVKFSRN